MRPLNLMDTQTILDSDPSLTCRPRLAHASLVAMCIALSACLGSGESTSPTAQGSQVTSTSETGGPLPSLPTGGQTAPVAVTSDTDVVRFIAMGDSGSGSPGQIATGDAMRQVCLTMGKQGQPAGLTDEQYILLGCQFALGFGDNIYEVGANAVDDKLFFDNFEKAYLTLPPSLRFYMAQGNHDNTGFLGYASQQEAPGIDTDFRRGDYQVAYSSQPVDSSGKNSLNPRKTPRWTMPSRYYSFKAGGTPSAPLVEFFAIDAITATSTVPDSNSKYAYDTYGQQQLLWLKNGLRASDAKFKVTFAHHPYLSNGSHGNAGAYEGIPNQIAPVASGQRYKDFLEEAMCDVSDMFMNGHDHDLEWLVSVPSCGRTEFLLSGAAGKSDRDLKSPDNNTVRMQGGLRYGFFWVEVRMNSATGKPQMRADLYSATPSESGSFSVQPYKIDGSKEGNPIKYNITQHDASQGLSDSQKMRRAFYMSSKQQDDFNVLQQKPLENPVFSGRTTSDPSYSCASGSQSQAASVQQSGVFDPLQTQLRALGNQAVARIADARFKTLTQAITQALIDTLDTADYVNTSSVAALTAPNSATAANQQQEALGIAVARTARTLSNLQKAVPAGTSLPAPFKDLPANIRLANTRIAASDCQNGRLSSVVNPIAGLTDTLAKQAEAARQMTGDTPVVAGLAQALVDALNNSTQLFVNIGTQRPTLVNDRIIATLDALLRSVVTDVVPLESAIASNSPVSYVTPVSLIGAASSPLKLITQDVSYQLERGLSSVPSLP